MTLLLAALGVAGAAHANEVLTVNFPQGFMDQCSEKKTARFTAQGPGLVTITITLIPYKSAGKVPNVTVNISWAGPSGPGFVEHLGSKYTQLGKEVKNWADGVPLVVERRFRLYQAREYVADIEAQSPGCWPEGGRRWQEGQEIHVDARAEGGATVTTARPSDEGAPQQIQTLFSTLNSYTVMNGPTRPTVFTLAKAARIGKIATYHWNNGQGSPPGTIALRGSSGETYGPWPATGLSGQGGAPNVQWAATPGVDLPAGTYTVIDSNPTTWAHNPASGGAGMAWADGYYK